MTTPTPDTTAWAAEHLRALGWTVVAPVGPAADAERMRSALWAVIREWQSGFTLSQATERQVLLALATDAERVEYTPTDGAT